MFDVIILGGGPAGLSAGIYAGRGGLRTLILEKMFAGGQAATTYEVENYPALENVTGPELAMKLEAHASKCGAQITYAEVTKLELEGKIKKVWTGDKEYQTKTVILAMGAQPKELGVDGERRLRGAGVSYCATCDGAFFKEKEVAVVGGGNVAVEDALYLSRFCKHVYLIHRRDELRADMVLRKAIEANEKITSVWDTVVEQINGEGVVSSLSLYNNKTSKHSELAVSGVFVAIGTAPETAIVSKALSLNSYGYIEANEEMRTEIEGVFVAGDIRQKPLKQIITAASDGAIAGAMAAQYIAMGY